jgi:hypothetical protein
MYQARRLRVELDTSPVTSRFDGDSKEDGFPVASPWIPEREPVQAPEGLDVEVLDLVRNTAELAQQSPLGSFTNGQAAEIEGALKALRETLNDHRQIAHLPETRWEEAWYRLAAAAATVAFSSAGACSTPLGSLAKSMLLDAAVFPGFQRTSGSEDYYDRDDGVFPVENPRAMAAQGLLRLAFWDSCVDDNFVQIIETLAGDRDPAVRLVVASEVYALNGSETDAMWRILEKICRSEERWGVVFWALKRPLHFMLGQATDRVVNLAADVYQRAKIEGPEFVRNAAIELLIGGFLRHDHPRSREILDIIAAQPADHADDVQAIAWHIRQQGGLVSNAEGASDTNVTALRARAFALFERIVRSATETLRGLYGALEGRADPSPTPEEQQQFEGIMKAVDAIAHAVYFASGAHDERSHATTIDNQPLPRDVKRRFLDEAGTLFDALAEFGQPRIAQELLLTFGAYVSLDPLGMWLRIAEVIRRAMIFGVQSRKLVADQVVELVEVYLADYRTGIWEDERGRAALIDILDGFVQIGWPKAVRLAFRLDQIYR